MKTQKRIFQIAFLFLFFDSYSQGFLITSPNMQFDGSQLKIAYDIVDKTTTDQFFVWVEMQKKNGERIKAVSLTGDIGEKIKAGPNKSIAWVPSSDSVFLNEEILVEVMAEKYVPKFHKGQMVLLSALMPGLGQSKIKGKPYWMAGVASYGALAGGFAMRSAGNKNYDAYLHDENPVSRNKLMEKAQNELNLSGVLIVSGAAIWAANLIWVAAIPNEFQPLKNARFSLEKSPVGNTPIVALTWNF
ncbi:MAG: hypothetical protein ACM3NR_03400 [Methanosarcina sp.]